VSLCNIYPHFGRFPFPIQSLIFKEYKVAKKKFADGDIGNNDYDERGICSCFFTRKYSLPCQHLFLADLINGSTLIDDEIWEIFVDRWEQCGYEVFFSREAVEVEEQQRPVSLSNAPLKTCIELLTNSFYNFQDQFQGEQLPNPMISFVQNVSQRLREMTEDNLPTFNLNNGQMHAPNNTANTVGNTAIDLNYRSSSASTPSMPQVFNASHPSLINLNYSSSVSPIPPGAYTRRNITASPVFVDETHTFNNRAHSASTRKRGRLQRKAGVAKK